MEFFVFSPPFKRYGPRSPICIERKFLTWNFVIKKNFFTNNHEAFFFKGAEKKDNDLWNRNKGERVENRLGK